MPEPIAVYLTDTHLSRKTFDINKSIYAQAYDLCVELGVKTLIHGGDVFDSRKSQLQDNLTFVREMLNRAHEKELEIHMLPGNHDKTDYASEDSFLDPFEHHPALTLYRNAGKFLVSNVPDIVFHMVPYFEEDEIYGEHLSKCEIEDGKKNILITHIAVSGVKNNDGTMVDNDIGSKMFSQFDEVIVGHYHDPSFIKPNINYVGASYQHNFGETEEKGFIVFYDDGSAEPYGSKFPQYKKVTIDVTQVTEKELEEFRDEYKDSEDNIRFEFVGDSDALSAIDKNKYSAVGIDVKFKSNESEEALAQAENEEFVSFDAESLKEEFKSFCDENKIEELDTGLEYLTKALDRAKE